VAASRIVPLLLLAPFVLAACGGGSHGASAPGSDPPLLVPWSRVGDIALGARRSQVEREYGSEGHGYHVAQRYGNNGNTVEGYYVLHGGSVAVTFYGDRVGRVGFGTPYYRTKSGFGVGSAIPLGPCHTTATNPCEHRWHGFVWNLRLREDPCGCWTKVGVGAQSLPATVANFLKPWFFIYTSHGRVSGFYFALKYVD
jgi:hypothetical protein